MNEVVAKKRGPTTLDSAEARRRIAIRWDRPGAREAQSAAVKMRLEAKKVEEVKEERKAKREAAKARKSEAPKVKKARKAPKGKGNPKGKPKAKAAAE
jgi:hypothetical protein